MKRECQTLHLENITPEEWRMVDAYLATGSFSDAGRLCGHHRDTCRRVWERYQPVVIEAVREAWEKVQHL